MNEGKHTDAELLADRILRAAGSGLRHYTMHSIREAIIKAAQDGIDQARATQDAPDTTAPGPEREGV